MIEPNGPFVRSNDDGTNDSGAEHPGFEAVRSAIVSFVRDTVLDANATGVVEFRSITDEDRSDALCASYDLDVTNLNRLRRTLTEQLDDQGLHDAVYGRNPYRDPSLPSLGSRAATADSSG